MVAKNNRWRLKAVGKRIWMRCATPDFAQVFVQDRRESPHDAMKTLIGRAMERIDVAGREEGTNSGVVVVGQM